MDELSLDDIKQRFIKNLGNGIKGQRKYTGAVTEKAVVAQGDIYGNNTVTRIKGLDEFLWNFGNRYAKLIKKIPVIYPIAMKHYWRIYNQQNMAALQMHKQPDANEVE
jgi:hypothetical protein